jgi:hypothetical protein
MGTMETKTKKIVILGEPKENRWYHRLFGEGSVRILDVISILGYEGVVVPDKKKQGLFDSIRSSRAMVIIIFDKKTGKQLRSYEL